MPRIKYTKKLIENVCSSSRSYRQCLQKLNLKEAGGNYACLKKRIAEYNVDISHFTHKGWNKGKVHGPKRPLKDYLSNKYPIGSYKLKNRLLKEGVFDNKCYGCGRKTWKNKQIPTELHHLDGNSKNNNLSNLQILCNNCHALTDNFRGKNK